MWMIWKMKLYRKLWSLDENILINVKDYSGYCDYKVRILLSRNAWGRQRKPLYFVDDFKGVASSPLDAEKLNTFREKGINHFVVLRFKVTHEWVKEKFCSRCFCHPVDLLHPKGYQIRLLTSAFLSCYKNDDCVLSLYHRLGSSG